MVAPFFLNHGVFYSDADCLLLVKLYLYLEWVRHLSALLWMRSVCSWSRTNSVSFSWVLRPGHRGLTGLTRWQRRSSRTKIRSRPWSLNVRKTSGTFREIWHSCCLCIWWIFIGDVRSCIVLCVLCFFLFRTPPSEVTERSSAEFCHVFGSEPNVKMDVQNLGVSLV